MFRCLGCPFTGLFYFSNIRNNAKEIGTYWLTSDYFIQRGNLIPYRPVGHHAFSIETTPSQERIMRECIADASILDRLSSLASAYYIVTGVVIGITKAIEPWSSKGKEWPYTPLLLAWTLPAIYKRVVGGRVLFIDPSIRLQQTLNQIEVENFDSDRRNQIAAHVSLTAIFSIVIPWTAVILVYFTTPVSFGCRCKYISLICSIWSFNNLAAYMLHIKGERNVSGHVLIHSWFCFAGVVVAILLFLLSMLSHAE